MDGVFVPNISFGFPVLKHVAKLCQKPLDVHLMMDQPETLLDAFLDAGAANVTVHAEAGDISGLIRKIHEKGATAGVALRPGTPLVAAQPYLESVELILTMTVEPGFGGQKLDERVIGKIRELRENGYTGEIEADGGIRMDNIRRLAESGLSVAVMGTALFRHGDMQAAISELHRI